MLYFIYNYDDDVWKIIFWYTNLGIFKNEVTKKMKLMGNDANFKNIS